MKTRKTRRKEWVQRVGFGLYVSLLVCLFAGAIVIAFTNHTGGIVVLAGFLVGVLLAVVFFAITEVWGNRQVPRRIALLLIFVSMFFGSWVIAPPSNGFVVKEESGTINLYREWVFSIPYTGQIDYIQDIITASTDVTLSSDAGDEVRWRVEAQLNLVAGHDQALVLFKEFKGKEDWISAVQMLFEQTVDQYFAEKYTGLMIVLPQRFSFDLKRMEEFLKLGFIPDGDCLARKISHTDKGG